MVRDFHFLPACILLRLMKSSLDSHFRSSENGGTGFLVLEKLKSDFGFNETTAASSPKLIRDLNIFQIFKIELPDVFRLKIH